MTLASRPEDKRPAELGLARKPRVFIFDTNAYRDFIQDCSLDEARKRAISLRAAEQRANHHILAHPIVIWELVSHLSTPSDPAYAHCLRALVTLAGHAASREQPDGSINLIADALSTVCRELFGRLPEGYETGLQNLGSFVTHIARHAPDLSNPVAQQTIRSLSSGRQAKKTEWIEGMKSILDHFTPDAARNLFGRDGDRKVLARLRKYFDSPDFFEAWSIYIVASNAVEVGITSIPPEELNTRAQRVRELFAVPFRLMVTLLKGLAGPDKVHFESVNAKRWNFIWDSMISFSLGPGTIEGAEVNMVTSDRQIAAAAREAGFGNHVVTLDEYLSNLEMK